MDAKLLEEIEVAFCDNADYDCGNCPLHDYQIGDGFAICYYGVADNKVAPEQQTKFLTVVRKHWDMSWNDEISDEALALLNFNAKVV